MSGGRLTPPVPTREECQAARRRGRCSERLILPGARGHYFEPEQLPHRQRRDQHRREALPPLSWGARPESRRPPLSCALGSRASPATAPQRRRSWGLHTAVRTAIPVRLLGRHRSLHARSRAAQRRRESRSPKFSLYPKGRAAEKRNQASHVPLSFMILVCSPEEKSKQCLQAGLVLEEPAPGLVPKCRGGQEPQIWGAKGPAPWFGAQHRENTDPGTFWTPV